MFLFLSTCSHLLSYWFFHIILLFFRYVFAQLRLVKKAWSKILYSKYCILYITVHKCFSHSSLPVERFSFNVFWPGIRVLIIIPQLKGNIINKIRETGGCLSFISDLLLYVRHNLSSVCVFLSPCVSLRLSQNDSQPYLGFLYDDLLCMPSTAFWGKPVICYYWIVVIRPRLVFGVKKHPFLQNQNSFRGVVENLWPFQ